MGTRLQIRADIGPPSRVRGFRTTPTFVDVYALSKRLRGRSRGVIMAMLYNTAMIFNMVTVLARRSPLCIRNDPAAA